MKKTKTYAICINGKPIYEMEFPKNKDYYSCCYELWDYFESIIDIQVEYE